MMYIKSSAVTPAVNTFLGNVALGGPSTIIFLDGTGQVTAPTNATTIVTVRTVNPSSLAVTAVSPTCTSTTSDHSWWGAGTYWVGNTTTNTNRITAGGGVVTFTTTGHYCGLEFVNGFMYGTDGNNGDLRKYDPSNNSFTTCVTASTTSGYGSYDSFRNYYWINDFTNARLVGVDLATFTVAHQFLPPAGQHNTYKPCFEPQTNCIFWVSGADRALRRYDPASGTVTGTISNLLTTTSANPVYLYAAANKLFISDFKNSNLIKINPVTMTEDTRWSQSVSGTGGGMVMDSLGVLWVAAGTNLARYGP